MSQMDRPPNPDVRTLRRMLLYPVSILRMVVAVCVLVLILMVLTEWRGPPSPWAFLLIVGLVAFIEELIFWRFIAPRILLRIEQ